MHWLVTGASGFTGRHLVRTLRSRGDRVTCVGRAPDNDQQCDLADGVRLAEVVRSARPDRVIHLAGVSRAESDDPDGLNRINVAGAEALLRACAQLASPPAVALASTSNVYGIHPGAVSETTRTEPVSDYGRSKLDMEAAALRWSDRLPILVARPFNYTGPGQTEAFLVAKIAAHFRLRAGSITLGDTSVVRDFSDVEDVVDDYIFLMDRGFAAFEVVNFCTGLGVTVAAVIQAFAELTGHRVEVLRSETLIRRNEIPVLVGDPTKLIRLSGRAHCRPLAATLATMLEPTSCPPPRP
ncbi:MAG: NAD-dependent epimerase/dehydratase family protein [Opitutales bacterium]